MNQSTNTKASSTDENSEVGESTIDAHSKHSLAATDAVLGAAAGAALGAMAGPPGAVAGALIGAIVGTAAGLASERGAAQGERENEVLDKEIGVIGGSMGAASPDQPPARIGAFSVGSMGVGSEVHPEVAAGPMQSLDDD
jgi:hypothetical protein